MQEVIDKLKELIEMLEEPEHTWLYSVPEKHRKFAAYWDEIGKPELEISANTEDGWCKVIKPTWNPGFYHRIKDDPNWQLRLKWVNSDKTMPIEFKSRLTGRWLKGNLQTWDDTYEYREVTPWYEQEISNDKPILLRWRGDFVELWGMKPINYDEYEPLTDQEIDALKRGF